jgi:predicted nucleic acid-binding protein
MDIGPLFALLHSHDRRHEATVAIFEELENADADISCAYPAALETHWLILKKGAVPVAHAHALISDILEIFPPTMPTEEDVDEAVQNLKRYSDHKITLTDATLAAMARREGRLMFTFDDRRGHFQLMGASVLGAQ